MKNRLNSILCYSTIDASRQGRHSESEGEEGSSEIPHSMEWHQGLQRWCATWDSKRAIAVHPHASCLIEQGLSSLQLSHHLPPISGDSVTRESLETRPLPQLCLVHRKPEQEEPWATREGRQAAPPADATGNALSVFSTTPTFLICSYGIRFHGG